MNHILIHLNLGCFSYSNGTVGQSPYFVLNLEGPGYYELDFTDEQLEDLFLFFTV